MTVAFAELGRGWQLVLGATIGALLLTASYVGACVLVSPRPVPRRSVLVALAVGVLVYLPAPFLAAVFILPAVAWLAYSGLAVPAAVIEGTGLRASLARGRQLARADYVHALGALAALTIVAFLSQGVLFFLLRGAGEATERAAGFLAALVITPILFLGAALLYFDQAAREIGSASRPRRSRDAQVPVDDHADRPGRSDAEGQPRPAARGQP
jgi:hypothetical protein